MKKRKKNPIETSQSVNQLNLPYFDLFTSKRKTLTQPTLANPSKNIIQFMAQEFSSLCLWYSTEANDFFLWKIDVLLLTKFSYISHILGEKCLIFLYVLYDKRQSYHNDIIANGSVTFTISLFHLLRLKQKMDFSIPFLRSLWTEYEDSISKIRLIMDNNDAKTLEICNECRSAQRNGIRWKYTRLTEHNIENMTKTKA